MKKCDCGQEITDKNKSGLCGVCLNKSNASVKRMMKQINKTKALKGVKY